MQLLIFLIILTTNCLAQPFPPDSVWTFGFDDGGDEYFYDAIEVSDGYLLCGEAREWNAMAGEALLVKIDRRGELVWSRRYPSDSQRRITQLPSEGRAWGEYTDASGQGHDILQMSFDSLGNVLGEAPWHAEPRPFVSLGSARTVYPDDDEGYILVYAVRHSSQNENSLFRYLCCGTIINLEITSGIGDLVFGEDALIDFAVCGETRTSENGKDGLLIWGSNPSQPGSVFHRWETGGENDDSFRDLVRGSMPNHIVACGSTLGQPQSSTNLWVVGVDSSGQTVWSRSYGGLAYEDGVEIVNADDTGFIIVGNFSSEDIEFEQSDFWLLKVDEDGDSVWSVVKGGDEADRCEGMIQTENGFLLFGASQSFAVPGWDGCAMLLAYVPDIAATPGSLNFGPVAVGDSLTRMIGLMNTGSNVLTVTGISSTENYHANFSGPATVAIGDTLLVSVVFTPQSPGTHVDTLHVTSDAISGVKNVRCLGAGTAAAADDASLLPTEFRLHPPYPNPFNPTTTIGFDVPRDARVELTIFDVQGRIVTTLLDGTLSAGTHSREWTCSTCAGGVYFARLRTSEFEGIQKLVLIK